MTQIVHDGAAGQFWLQEDGYQASLHYRKEGNSVVIFRTHVPAEIGGRGLAGKLTEAALQWARAEGLQVNPQCSYVDNWMKRHAEYADLLASG
ncbi:GNAT family N-acetyltransferase [Lysobacteraceae bacterium NML07-0707]|nr:GNAT family N-acetyltransferase [Xanthomonadaceae bacterium NML07-0707]